jgi:hypothetical protein
MKPAGSLGLRQLNRATLDRQFLLDRSRLEPVAAVSHLVALQAQDPVNPYLALHARLEPFDPVEVDEAFAGRRLVRASLLRLTLHVTTAQDRPWLHRIMEPSLRAARLNDRRYTSQGLSATDADALVDELVTFAEQPRTSAEIELWLDERSGGRGRLLWWALQMFAPIHDVPTGGPWSFGQPRRFTAAATGGGQSAQLQDRNDDVASLVVRYLRAYGPATMRDLEQFTMLRRPVVSEAVRTLGEELIHLGGPGRAPLLDVRGLALPHEDAEATPRLLPMWDNVLLAHHDRNRILPEPYRPLVIRRNGDVLPTVLVDGSVAGVWRPVGPGLEVTTFQPLRSADWEAIEVEAQRLAALLTERQPDPYRRFAHWWDKGLPGHETRVLNPEG